MPINELLTGRDKIFLFVNLLCWQLKLNYMFILSFFHRNVISNYETKDQTYQLKNKENNYYFICKNKNKNWIKISRLQLNIFLINISNHLNLLI